MCWFEFNSWPETVITAPWKSAQISSALRYEAEVIWVQDDDSPISVFGQLRPFRGNGIHPIGDVFGCFDGDRASFQLKQPNFASIRPRCWEFPSEVAIRSAIRDGL
jgi:hypothetical protein